jgi:hypothetical protein
MDGRKLIDQVYTPASENISFLVKRFIFLKSFSLGETYFDKYIPDGYTAIVINFSGNIHVIPESRDFLLPRYFLIAPVFSYIPIRVKAPSDSMIIIFHTTVFTKVFGVDFSKPVEKPYLPADKIISAGIVEKLAMLATDQERVCLFEKYILEISEAQPYERDDIDELFDTIIGNGGEKISISNMVAGTKLNERTFRRKFLCRAGMNAKNLNRVVRVNYLWSLYLDGRVSDFQSMVDQGNYFDQAHLIKDFKILTGESPKSFFRRDQKVLRFISGKFTPGENGNDQAG